jgi:putative oxidoreductase
MTAIRLLARPMLASMFVVGGINALRNAEAHAQMAEPVADKLVPAAQKAAQKAAPRVSVPEDTTTLVRINGAAQVVAGLALATGRTPRLASSLLAATLVPTTLAGHRFWEESDPGQRQNQQIHFLKNVSMLGGLLLAGVDTEGKPGLAWRAGHAASDVRRESRRLAHDARREAKLAKAQLT